MAGLRSPSTTLDGRWVIALRAAMRFRHHRRRHTTREARPVEGPVLTDQIILEGYLRCASAWPIA